MADHPVGPMPLGIGRRIWRRLLTWRPRHRVSLFLMLAMVVALILGLQIVGVREDPKGLAWFLALYFVFFLMVIGRAIFEIFDIIREHVREREAVFRKTFADGDFSAELGRRVGKADGGSWPE
jgi:hypothetical protein